MLFRSKSGFSTPARIARDKLSRAPDSLSRAILAGVEKPDFASIKVPVLSFAAMRSVADCLRSIQREDDAAHAACAETTARSRNLREARNKDFQRIVPHAQVVELPAANHYIFISNEEDVQRELRSFLGRLR